MTSNSNADKKVLLGIFCLALGLMVVLVLHSPTLSQEDKNELLRVPRRGSDL